MSLSLPLTMCVDSGMMIGWLVMAHKHTQHFRIYNISVDESFDVFELDSYHLIIVNCWT